MLGPECSSDRKILANRENRKVLKPKKNGRSDQASVLEGVHDRRADVQKRTGVNGLPDW
jgi:hypothetical protein